MKPTSTLQFCAPLFSAMVFVALWALPFEVEASLVHEATADNDFRTYRSLAPGEHRVWTANVSAGGWSVVHVFDTTTGTQVASSAYCDPDLCPQACDNPQLPPACARFTNPGPSSRTYLIVVRPITTVETASDGGAGLDFRGTANLLVDGNTVATNQPFRGAVLPAHSIVNGTYLQSALQPGGSPDTLLYLFQGNPTDLYGGTLVAYNDQSGSGNASRIHWGPSRTTITGFLAVSTYTTNQAGTTRVVQNARPASPTNCSLIEGGAAGTPWDADCDGLSNNLETELGTCASSAGWAGDHCLACLELNPRDTDGDGLPDASELLGLLGAGDSQTLSRWGADPLHKDVFMEADWCPIPDTACPSSTQLLSAGSAQTAAGLLADGPGGSLMNPSCEDGIHTHVDNGIATPAGSTETRWGNWGGARCVSRVGGLQGTCQAAGAVWETEMTSSRHGLFQYAMITPEGGGNAPIGSPWLTSNWDARTWVHELGHALGLDHCGNGRAGFADCKPHYVSLMNNAYYPFAGYEFSPGAFETVVLDMIDLDEVAGLSTGTSTGLDFLTGPPFHYGVGLGGRIDWDRDAYYRTHVVANITAAWSTGCRNPEWATRNLHLADAPVGSPQLAQLGGEDGYLYVFDHPWASGQYRRVRESALVDCEPYSGDCTIAGWESPKSLSTTGRGIGVDRYVADHEYLVVVMCDTLGRLRARRMWLSGSGTENWSSWFYLSANYTCRDEPEVLVWPWDDRLRVLYRREANNQIGMLRINEDWTASDLGTIQVGQPVATGVAPTAAVSEIRIDLGGWWLILDQVTVVRTDPTTRQIRAFGSVNGTSWYDMSVDLFGSSPSSNQRTEHKMGFAWQRWPNHETGRHWLVWSQYNPDGDGLAHLSFTDTTGMLNRDTLYNTAWTLTREGFDLWVDDSSADGRERLRAVDMAPWSSGSWTALRFWQHADGVYDVPLCDYDDWSALRFWACGSLSTVLRSWEETLAYCRGEPELSTACSGWSIGTPSPPSGEEVTCRPGP